MPSQVKAEWREAELARLQKITDQAFLERLQGNQAMKDGDDTTALRMFHGVLLQLKGVYMSFKSSSCDFQHGRHRFELPGPRCCLKPTVTRLL